MSELSKWQPQTWRPVKPGHQCGNPKCGAVRQQSNHWFTGDILIGNIFLVRPWSSTDFSSLPLGVELRFAMCGEQCASIAQSIYMKEVVSRALQQAAEVAP